MNPKSSSASGGRKAERSKQSARDCRIRKKLRYQYLEELVNCREQAVFALRKELEQLKAWCVKIDGGEIPPDFVSYVTDLQKKLVDLNILTVVPAEDNDVSEASLPSGLGKGLETVRDFNITAANACRNYTAHSRCLSESESAVSGPVSTTSASSSHVEGSLLTNSAVTLSPEVAETLWSLIATQNLIELPAEVCDEELEIHSGNFSGANDAVLDFNNDFVMDD